MAPKRKPTSTPNATPSPKATPNATPSPKATPKTTPKKSPSPKKTPSPLKPPYHLPSPTSRRIIKRAMSLSATLEKLRAEVASTELKIRKKEASLQLSMETLCAGNEVKVDNFNDFEFVNLHGPSGLLILAAAKVPGSVFRRMQGRLSGEKRLDQIK